MIRTIPAMIDVDGQIRLLESVSFHAPRRAFVMILDENDESPLSESALLSEAALAADWNRPEEDAAWSGLKPVK